MIFAIRGKEAQGMYFENKMRLRDLISVRGTRVFVRGDFNVPLKNGEIMDDTRIVESLPTIRHLLKSGAKVVLASHLGRPKGERVEEFSLAPVAKRLSELLGQNVALAKDCVGEEVKAQVNDLKAGDALLLENLRFHAEEEANDAAFSKELASLADVYVNDAFGTAHRAHASTVGVPTLVKSAVAGFLMEKELEYLGKIVTNPERPFYALLGGAKVSDKIGVFKHLVKITDGVLIGGAMAYPFLAETGWHIGSSLTEDGMGETVREVLQSAGAAHKAIHLPEDHVVALENGSDAWTTYGRDIVPAKYRGMDIGPKTLKSWLTILRNAKTIFWNGPLGVYEFDKFAIGTMTMALDLGELADQGTTVVIGGGDVVAAVHKAGVADKMAHMSTGGGASLEFIEGKELPGVVALFSSR